jgi:hypothetical protein
MADVIALSISQKSYQEKLIANLRDYCIFEAHHDFVAQLVEQMTLNHWVESSNLSGVTKGSDVKITV